MPADLTVDRLSLELERETGRVLDLLLAKRQDYGTANINLCGLSGVAVRLVDKTARLHNLTRDPLHPVRFEPVRDTLNDIVGYGLIGLWLESGREW